MIVRLRNPNREIQMAGPALVSVLLERLELNRESVLVVRNGTLVPGDARLEDTDEVEVRPVISGGAFEPAEVTPPHTLRWNGRPR
ncbi:MAG: MoaD/ThiS family protein [Actinomycetes bacterium]